MRVVRLYYVTECYNNDTNVSILKNTMSAQLPKIQLRTHKNTLATRIRPTKSDFKKMLISHIINTDGSDLQVYLPYIQFGYPGKLTEQQRKDLWNAVEIIVMNTERQHFKLMSQPEDYHDDRVLAFYELTINYWDKSPAWCVTAFKKGFSEIEALLQMRRLGICLDSNNLLEYRQTHVKFFVAYFALRRKQEKDPTWSYEKQWLTEHPFPPTPDSIHLWDNRCRHLEQAINRCPHYGIYGFKDGYSFEELYENELKDADDNFFEG